MVKLLLTYHPGPLETTQRWNPANHDIEPRTSELALLQQLKRAGWYEDTEREVINRCEQLLKAVAEGVRVRR